MNTGKPISSCRSRTSKLKHPNKTVQPNAKRIKNIIHGFTLIELLVVVAIISVLVSILLPAMKAARDSAISVACQSNLRQMGVATQSYLLDNNEWFPAGGKASNGSLWKVLLSKYLAATVRKANSEWISDNWAPIYACPGSQEPGKDWYNHITDYKIGFHKSAASTFGISGYDGPQPVSERLSYIQRPLDSVAWVVDGSDYYSSFVFFPWPSGYLYFYRDVELRHKQQSNILWADWHVSNTYPVPMDFYNR